MPAPPSAIPRLAHIARQLGPNSIALFADHPDLLDILENVPPDTWAGEIPVWVSIDVGYHREGVPADSQQLADIASRAAKSKRVKLAGVYTHLGSSYGVSSPEEALECMAQELEGLEKGALSYLKSAGITTTASDATKMSLSIGATPTATSVQNLLSDDSSEASKKYRAVLDRVKASFAVELHAGVYPVMDMQQLATRARPPHALDKPDETLLSYRDLGFRLLVEVASLYPDRGAKPEALIAAGSIVLGREPCKSYEGWGVVTPWPAPLGPGRHYDPEGSKTGWIVGRISQEHGILTWKGAREGMRELEIGQKLLLWPNHACIAGVNFGWFLVVDSEMEKPDRVVDVWLRWRGW